jgi:PAS domain S-box-containing protein
MSLDVPTLMQMLILLTGLLGLSTMLIARGDGLTYLRPWSVALLLQTLTYFGYALRGFAPDWLSIVLTNVILSASYALMTNAIASFNSAKLKPLWLFGPPLAVVLIYPWIIERQDLRNIVSTLIFGSQLTLMCWTLLRCGTPTRGHGQRLLGAALATITIILFLRLILAGSDPAPGIITQHPWQVTILLVSILATLTATIGFILMLLERANQQTAERNDLLAAILDSVTETIAMYDRNGSLLRINTIGARRFNASPDQMLGRHMRELMPADIASQRLAAIAAADDSGQVQQLIDQRDGRIYQSTFYPVAGNSGRIVIYSADITESKAAEDQLSFLSQRSLILLELPRLADVLDEATLMQRGLEMTEQLTGSVISFIHFVNEDEASIELITWSRRTLESYCHATYDRHYPISQAGIWAEAFRQRQAVVYNDYATATGKHGLPEGHAPLQRLISLPVIEQGKVVMLVGVGNKAVDYDENDVQTTQLIANEIWRLVERSRHQAKIARFSRMIERSMNEIFSFDAETLKFIDANRGALENTGYTLDELRNLTPLDLKPEMTAASFAELLAPLRAGTLKLRQFTTRHRRKDGSTYPVEVHLELTDDIHPVFVAVVLDIGERLHTERELASNLERQTLLNKKLEEAHNQLLQSEKMASIGQLAAGVAHELNNPIGFVHSNLGTLEVYLQDIFQIADACEIAANHASNPQDFSRINALKAEKDFEFIKTDIFQLMSESKDGLARVRKIVQDLKDFSRIGEVTWQWADMHQCLDSTLNIVWNELKYKCEVSKDYAADLPQIRCLPSQLNQVFMNLLVNAAHAIKTRGQVTISTRRGSDNPATIQIIISDTGAGIPKENLNRIFDPFFTTKPVGQGTGLGLSIAYGIIGKHHGKIEVDSTVGKGTRFTLTLPIDPPDTDDAVASAPTLESS